MVLQHHYSKHFILNNSPYVANDKNNQLYDYTKYVKRCGDKSSSTTEEKRPQQSKTKSVISLAHFLFSNSPHFRCLHDPVYTFEENCILSVNGEPIYVWYFVFHNTC